MRAKFVSECLNEDEELNAMHRASEKHNFPEESAASRVVSPEEKDIHDKTYGMGKYSTRKDDLIEEIMNTVYADDDPSHDASNERYLESLTISQLEDKLADWKNSEEDDFEDDEDEEYEDDDEEEEESGVPDHYPESGVGDWSWR